MSKLHIPESFIGSEQEELLELHSEDRFLDAAQAAAEENERTREVQSPRDAEVIPMALGRRALCAVAA